MPTSRESQPDDTLPQSDAPRSRSGFHPAKRTESGAVPAFGRGAPSSDHAVDAESRDSSEPTPSLPRSWNYRLVEATRPTEQPPPQGSVPVLANPPDAPPPLPPLPRLPPPPFASSSALRAFDLHAPASPSTPSAPLVPSAPDTVPSRRRAAQTQKHAHPDEERLRLLLVFVLAFAIALVVASLTVAIIAVARGHRF